MGKYLLFVSSPIDHFEDFDHISMVHLKILRYLADRPYHAYTYSDVWKEIMNKLYWAWCQCREVDKALRSSDVYIYLCLFNEGFICSILFKSDNNGTVNLIVDDTFDAKTRVLAVPHEQQGEWEQASGLL
jgi:hypothetical protein